MNRFFVFVACIALSPCGAESNSSAAAQVASNERPFIATPVATLDEPWAMTFLPDGRMLITEKKGRLLVVTQDGDKAEPVSGVPEVDYGGQGGLGDVVLPSGVCRQQYNLPEFCGGW